MRSDSIELTEKTFFRFGNAFTAPVDQDELGELCLHNRADVMTRPSRRVVEMLQTYIGIFYSHEGVLYPERTHHLINDQQTMDAGKGAVNAPPVGELFFQLLETSCTRRLNLKIIRSLIIGEDGPFCVWIARLNRFIRGAQLSRGEVDTQRHRSSDHRSQSVKLG